MRAQHRLERLEPMVLGRLGGLRGDAWHQAPAGKWSICQIVQHLAMSVDTVGDAFENRASKRPMKRRATPYHAIARRVLLGLGKFPTGIASPESVRPPDRPNPELVVRLFRTGVRRLSHLVETWPPQRQLEIYVRHPFVGDLNLPEWIRFHYVHCRHHAKQIDDRLRWMARTRAAGAANP